MIQKICLTDWEQYRGLEYYRPQEVVDSLVRLFNLTEENDNNDTYNFVLSSIGNNHGGEGYPYIEHDGSFNDFLEYDKKYNL